MLTRLVAFGCLFMSCSGSDAGQNGGEGALPIGKVFRDDLGREILLKTSPPQRIISLAPSITEILFAVGAGERVVGVTEFCNYPPSVAEIEKVGGFSYLNLERLLSLKPDLVILSSHEQQRFIENLEELQVPVYVCFPSNFPELFHSIRTIGTLVGQHERGQSLANSLEADLNALRRDVESIFGEGGRLKAYIEISSHPLMTVGEHSFIGALITEAGGENIGRDIPRDYAVINSEVVIDRNPDVIFLFHSSSTRENLVRRLGWGRIRAVQTNTIFDELDEDIIFRPGPRSVQGARGIFECFVEAKGKYGEDMDEE